MRVMVAARSVSVLLWNFESLDAGAAAVLVKNHLQIFEGTQNLVLRLVGLQESGKIQTNAGNAIGNRHGTFDVFDLVAKEGIVALPRRVRT